MKKPKPHKKPRKRRYSKRRKKYEASLHLRMGDRYCKGSNYTPKEIKDAIKNQSYGRTAFFANSCLGALIKRLFRARNQNPKRIKTRVFWHLSRIRAIHSSIFSQRHPNIYSYQN